MSATPKMEDDEKMTTTTATESAVPELEMPGFRFHPTEEELLDFYLKHMVFGKKMRFDIIGFLNIYHHDPWDLPGLAKIGEREWYFYVPMDRKHGHGGRPNRTTEQGFWKATGSDRTIRSIENPKRIIGLRKTLVFYTGRAPRGCKTDWVMNEYRLPLTCKTLPKDDIVLCKIYRKATSLKVLEQRAAMEEETKSSSTSHTMFSSPSRSTVSDDLTVTDYSQEQNLFETLLAESKDMVLKAEEVEKEQNQFQRQEENMTVIKPSPSLLRTGLGDKEHLPVLQLPKVNLDWTQDQFWTQLHSPWLDNWLIHANVL